MNAVVEQKTSSPAQEFRDQFKRMDNELSAALPPHIPVERFMRVVLTAVNADSSLLNADRRSLFAAAMKAAQDGLLPDGRDGAFVLFSKTVTWMPMVGGILKKVRNSGDLLTIAAHVAYSKDKFSYRLGDEESIEHEPSIETDRGVPVVVYAVAKTKDGGIYREVMSVKEIEQVRAVSKAAKNGPWVSWWGEMAKKTVIRRLAKRLPMSTDLDDLIRREDELYDFNKAGNGEGQVHRLFKPVRNPLSDENQIEHEDANGAPTDDKPNAGNPPADGKTTDSPNAAGVSPPSGEQAGPDAQTEEPAQSGPVTGEQQQPVDDDTFPGDRPPSKSTGRKFIRSDLRKGEE